MTSDSIKKIDKMKEISQDRANAQGLQFALPFGGNTRAVSNPMARCALFAAVKKRSFFKDYVFIGGIDGMKLEFKGEQFNQDDHDVLMQLVIMAREQPIGSDITQTVNEVLKSLGRQTYPEQRRQLFIQMDRLVSGTLRITPEGSQSFAGSILVNISTPVHQKILKRHKRHLTYSLNPKFAIFYRKNAYTLIDFRQRLQLTGRGSELAKWLHLFLASHAVQYRYKVETLRVRSGSITKDLNKFRHQLKQALNLLTQAGIITDWHIDPVNDLVTINRTPSSSQHKHRLEALKL